MQIEKAAVAGTLESSDCMVTVEDGDGNIDLVLESTVIHQYGNQIRHVVLDTLEKKESHFHVLYEDTLSLKEKIAAVSKEIYGADGVVYSPAAEKQLKKLTELGFGGLPVCMAKTQYSLSDNPDLLGRPEGFEINVREAYVSAGAGFVVVLTGAVMTMPGLPKTPAAFSIDVDEDGRITGLF